MTCAFVSCLEATSCGLVGGCVQQRFGRAPTRAPQSEQRKTMHNPTRNGIVVSSASLDPRVVRRTRRALR